MSSTRKSSSDHSSAHPSSHTSSYADRKHAGLKPDSETEFSPAYFPAQPTTAVAEKHQPINRVLINVRYLLAGLFLGIVFVKAEIISWYRIQEMFRLQSFHMYGVIGSAILTAMLSVFIIKKYRIKTLDGNPVTIPSKKFHRGQVIGGLLFGFGWAMTGACPGPLFTQIGSGYLVVLIVLISAVAGTWIYGYTRKFFS